MTTNRNALSAVCVRDSVATEGPANFCDYAIRFEIVTQLQATKADGSLPEDLDDASSALNVLQLI